MLHIQTLSPVFPDKIFSRVARRKSIWSLKMSQGDQVPGNYWAGPEIICSELFSKARNFSKISQISLFSLVFLQILANLRIKRVQIWLEIGFCDARYQKLRPISAAVRNFFFWGGGEGSDAQMSFQSKIMILKSFSVGIWNGRVVLKVCCLTNGYIPLLHGFKSHSRLTKKYPSECMRFGCRRPDAVVSQGISWECRDVSCLSAISDSPRHCCIRVYGLWVAWCSSGE